MNEAALEEKRYTINGRVYILRPMTLAREIEYLTAIEEARQELEGDESGPMATMKKIAAKVPEILAIALDVEDDLLSRSELIEEIKDFTSTRLEEIVNDFFDVNPSWAVGQVSARVTAILGIVMGRAASPPETSSSAS